jgi:uncharacterized protein (DUF1778 family)
MNNKSSTLPIAFKMSERELVQAAARQLGKPESTYVRETVIEAARAQLEHEGDDS